MQFTFGFSALAISDIFALTLRILIGYEPKQRLRAQVRWNELYVMGVQDEDVPHVKGVMGRCGWWRIYRRSFDRTEGTCGHRTEPERFPADARRRHDKCIQGMDSARESLLDTRYGKSTMAKREICVVQVYGEGYEHARDGAGAARIGDERG